MPPTNLDLKSYQRAATRRFRDFLRGTSAEGANVAFYRLTGLPYRQAPIIAEGTPYVCLRVPTGGGKTLLAAHAIGVAARDYMQSSNPTVLWLVPSAPILDQTVAALKNLDHPYRTALNADFGRNLTILTREEALSLSRADAEGGACIIVATIQSFRREADNGRENPDGLKVYADNGALMDHFQGLSREQIAGLAIADGTDRPVASLANLLRLHRPMVIVDEAHNARTPLSFDTLARFRPSLILELTATPQLDHDPARDRHASNILYSVSAAELKAEAMIKLPIRLTTDGDWRKTVGAALDCRAKLEEAAKAEEAETGEYIRPIALIQAQATSKNDPHRITWEVIERQLVEDHRIPKEEIAVHTGARKDLDGIRIDDPACPVRYVVTVQKLKEGWDCPFAYVFCSVAEQTSATAVEQILGRVLRLPKASRKRRDALNQAYAFVASRNFDATAQQLRDGLVDGAGFERIEAELIVAPQADLGFARIAEQAEHVADLPDDDPTPVREVEAALQALPLSVKTRVAFDTERKSFTWRGPMSKEARNTLQLAMARNPHAAKVIDRLYARANNLQTSAAQDDVKAPFIVPLLGRFRQGELRLFDEEHFLDLPWELHECDASAIVDRFRIVDRSQTGQIDVSAKGRIEIDFVRNMQAELAAVVQEPAWTEARLCNWLDMGIRHRDVTKPSAIIFLRNALEALKAAGHSLDVLARNKYDLREALRILIEELRRQREKGRYAALISANAEDFATSPDLSIIFDEQTYAPNQPYAGATKFRKHYTTLIGDLKPSGEEFDCALHLDRSDAVRTWIRNVDRKPHAFWLQMPQGRFYPDFVAQLHDERILVVEYKGAQLYEQETDKRRIGEVWAEATNGRGLFCMPTDRDYALIDRTIAASGGSHSGSGSRLRV